MGEVIEFPESPYCLVCGAIVRDEICIVTATINGHLGTFISCEECLEKRRAEDESIR